VRENSVYMIGFVDKERFVDCSPPFFLIQKNIFMRERELIFVPSVFSSSSILRSFYFLLFDDTCMSYIAHMYWRCMYEWERLIDYVRGDSRR
jgi:hypothetical protein